MRWSTTRKRGGVLLLISSLLLCALGEQDESAWRLYRPLETAGSAAAAASLNAIRQLALKRFELTHDTRSGRVHHGVMPKDAETALAHLYAERVTHSEAVPGAKGGLRRLVVDETVLFTHGLVLALQSLAKDSIPATEAGAAALFGRYEVIARSLAPFNELVEADDWKTAAQTKPLRLLEEAKSETLRTRIDKLEAKRLRRGRVSNGTDVLQRASRTLADGLARNRTVGEHELLEATILHQKEEEEASDGRLETVRLATALIKLRGDFDVAEEREKLRATTAIEVALENERQKANAERLNEDMNLRMISARGAEAREKVAAAITAIAVRVANGFNEMRENPSRLRRLTLSILGVIAGYFLTREAAKLARKMLKQYLTRPSLVRETSYTSRTYFVIRKIAIAMAQFLSARVLRRKPAAARESLTDGIIILERPTAERLELLASSIRGARSLGAPLRHLLLYGPPGTGKTMLARRLAEVSGLDWAMMSGGDVGPLGEQAATEVHAILEWAKRSPRGLLLFVDEAEAALCDRRRDYAMSEEAVSALNAFLYHTSSPSYSLVLVLATNRPDALDGAVLDRVDEMVEVPLPDEPNRLRLLELYFDQYFHSSQPVIEVTLPEPREALRGLAARTQGFSGRELSKLLLSVQGAVYAQPLNWHRPVLQLTPQVWQTSVAWKLYELKPRSATSHYYSRPNNDRGATPLATRIAPPCSSSKEPPEVRACRSPPTGARASRTPTTQSRRHSMEKIIINLNENHSPKKQRPSFFSVAQPSSEQISMEQPAIPALVSSEEEPSPSEYNSDFSSSESADDDAS